MRQGISSRSDKRWFPVSAISRFVALRNKGVAGLAIFVGTIIVLSISLMTVSAPWISPRDPSAINVGPVLASPSIDFPLGTDHLGRDMLSRVISGGSIMLQVALLSVPICLFVGVPIGLLAAYIGGIPEKVTSLVMDCVYAFPGLILAIAIAAVLGPGVFNMTLAIVVVYIPSYYRVVRSQVLSIKELTYVDAARAIGATGPSIVFRYILPNVLPSVIAVSSVNFADAILTAAGLTFIGLGLPVSTPDWGWDLTNGRQLLPSGAWWVMTFPGIMIVLLALGFTLVGEGLNELLNPKLEVQVS